MLVDGNVLVGSGGYKGPPTEQGMVEIGYEIAEAYRGRGFATEMAQLLVQKALEAPEVQLVQAHTLAEENASVKVLRKCGFQHVETLSDPDEGDVWRWELKRPA